MDHPGLRGHKPEGEDSVIQLITVGRMNSRGRNVDGSADPHTVGNFQWTPGLPTRGALQHASVHGVRRQEGQHGSARGPQPRCHTLSVLSIMPTRNQIKF